MKLSIFITCFNNGHYIDRILRSIDHIALIHEDDFIEVVVIDDNGESGDPVCDLEYTVNNFKHSHFNTRIIDIKYIKHPFNRGTLIARQTGVKNCTGDYIIGVDGDDCLIPDDFDTIVNNLKKYKPDVCECKCLTRRVSKELTDKYKVKIGFYIAKENLLEFEEVVKHPMTWSKIVKRDVYMKAINMQPEIEHCVIAEDAFSSFTILLNAKTFLGLDVHFYYYEVDTTSSLTRRVEPDKLHDLSYTKYLEYAGFSIPLITPRLYRITCNILESLHLDKNPKIFRNIRYHVLSRFYNTDRNRFIALPNGRLKRLYEISCNEQYGEDVWNAMLEALKEGNIWNYFTPNKLTDKYGIDDISDDPIKPYELDFFK